MRTYLALVLFASTFAFPLVAAEKANLVLIMADDLPYGDLGCFGSKVLRTPNIDKMAAEGLKLTSFYSGNTVCTPSRMALLTGAYPPRLGWDGGVVGYGVDTKNGLAPDALTMAEVFKAAGYRTFMSGKWHLGDAMEFAPMKQGFDSAYWIQKSNNQTKKLWRDDALIEEPFENRKLSEQFTQEAIRFIKNAKAEPFFLYLPYTAPHFPAQSHPDWKDRSSNHAYGDVVEELDARVGEVLQALKDEGLDEKTLVVFTSDNGPDGSQRKWASAKPLRGMKWMALEGGSRVPFVVRWPGNVPAGAESDRLAGAIDLLPTLAKAAAGIDVGTVSKGVPKIDGLDLWSSWTQGAKHPREELLIWNGWATLQAIRVGDHKLYVDTLPEIAGSEKGPVLIDLQADIEELKDLSAEQPERVAQMLKRVNTRMADIEAHSLLLGGPPSSQAKPKRAGKSGRGAWIP